MAGELVTAAFMNANIRDAGNFFLGRPLAVLRQVTTQSVPNNAWTPILLDTEDIDRDNAHSTSSNTSRYTAATPGYYWLAFTLVFLANATGRRGVRMMLNGTDTAQGSAGRTVINAATAGFDTGMSAGGAEFLNGSTDYFEVVGYQDSGGALGTQDTTQGGARLQVIWVSS